MKPIPVAFIAAIAASSLVLAGLAGAVHASALYNASIMRLGVLVRDSQCVVISNLSYMQPQRNVTVLGYPFTFNGQLIMPNYTRISINGVPYLINATSPAAISAGDAIYSVALSGFSHSPTLQSASFRVCGELFTPILPVHVYRNITAALPYNGAFNVSYYLSDNITLAHEGLSALVTSSSVLNSTVSMRISLFGGNTAVDGYSLINVYNVSMNKLGSVYAVITDPYPCSINASAVQPFMLSQGVWSAVNSFSISKGSCTASFSVPADPVIALYRKLPSNAAPANQINSANAPYNATASNSIKPNSASGSLPSSGSTAAGQTAPNATTRNATAPSAADHNHAPYNASIEYSRSPAQQAIGYAAPAQGNGSVTPLLITAIVAVAAAVPYGYVNLKRSRPLGRSSTRKRATGRARRRR